MERTPVSSTDIAIIGYDKNTLTLEVTFRRGGVYHYHSIPQNVYQELMAAGSHGTYFNQNIKDKYKSVKVS